MSNSEDLLTYVLTYLDLVHVSNGLADVTGNQLTTPEFNVTEIEQRLWLYFIVDLRHQDACTFQLSVYILNELYHRLPDRLYSREVVRLWNDTRSFQVGYLSCICRASYHGVRSF